mgnify:CR=1 FL=1
MKWMRPKICVPIVAPLRDGIIREAKQIAKLPVEMVEWRIDFFAGYGREILDVITELKRVLNEKELLVTIRTVAEGGEENGSRFDYFETMRKILEQQTADYVDVEAARDEEEVKALCQKYSNTKTKVIGSYHDFSKTPSVDEIKERLCKAKECGCYAGKLACMPKTREDVDTLLNATAAMKEEFPDYGLVAIFGCPGKKSLLRRKYLGTIAGQYSNMVYLVAEDPGYEPVEDISKEIAQYVEAQHCPYKMIEDRGEAIKDAIETAEGKTLLLVTGKGAETRQKYGCEYLDCPSDVEYVQRYLAEYDSRH